MSILGDPGKSCKASDDLASEVTFDTFYWSKIPEAIQAIILYILTLQWQSDIERNIWDEIYLCIIFGMCNFHIHYDKTALCSTISIP